MARDNSEYLELLKHPFWQKRHSKAEFIKYIHRFGHVYLSKVDKIGVAEVSEIIEIVTRRLQNNYNSESAHRYMDGIKLLMSYG